ncbi:MAG: cytochrome c-type biogenesis CcmF C-terminal domain-containing protein [Dehalococcoidia bacterium]
MSELGTLSLVFALILAVYSVVGSVIGVRKGLPELGTSARYATYLTPLPVLIAILSLVGAFLSRDFQVEYVAENSNLAMSRTYAWVAFYAGNDGSILFLAAALSIMAAIAIALAPRLSRASLSYTNAVLMAVLAFFLFVLVFLANPFDISAVTPPDGRGINPLLTHPGMFIHPPLLMTGLIAVTVPFAFAMGALLSGRTGDDWVDTGRAWALVAWGVLGSGLLLGGWWAYTILGWGGFWAWDPVENAGFMPWLILTAFIHSIMVQKRRGMFRVWNIALINIAFTSALLGMFINRGGPTPSVHSFAQSILGWVFLGFMAFVALSAFGVLFHRMPNMKNAQSLESKLSRESAFLINNILFLAMAFVIIWGQVFPILSDLVTDVSITVGEPFYNRVNGPLLLGVIFLMGIGPLLPWRHASVVQLRKALLLPFAAALLVALLLLALGVTKPYPLLAFGLATAVAMGILREWYRGTRARHRKGEGYPIAFLRLIAANRPRYGGYVVHLSVVLIALAVVGTYFYATQRDVILAPGERVTVGGYDIEYIESSSVQFADRTESVAKVTVERDGRVLGTYEPRQAFYPRFSIAPAQAAIRSTPIEDLYIIPNDFFDDGTVGFRILVNPLVMWMWIAGPVLVLGTVIALWPQGRRAVLTSQARAPTLGPAHVPAAD